LSPTAALYLQTHNDRRHPARELARRTARSGWRAMRCLCAAVLASIIVGPTFAQTSGAPADLSKALVTRFDVCEVIFEIALVRDDAHQEDAENCIDDALARAAASYPGAIFALRGQRPATTQLEDFYTLWQSQMNDLLPQPTETVDMYADRQEVARKEIMSAVSPPAAQ
jgi:hypothetical protein